MIISVLDLSRPGLSTLLSVPHEQDNFSDFINFDSSVRRIELPSFSFLKCLLPVYNENSIYFRQIICIFVLICFTENSECDEK